MNNSSIKPEWVIPHYHWLGATDQPWWWQAYRSLATEPNGCKESSRKKREEEVSGVVPHLTRWTRHGSLARTSALSVFSSLMAICQVFVRLIRRVDFLYLEWIFASLSVCLKIKLKASERRICWFLFLSFRFSFHNFVPVSITSTNWPWSSRFATISIISASRVCRRRIFWINLTAYVSACVESRR